MQDASIQTLKNSIVEFAEVLEISQMSQDNTIKTRDFKIRVYTEDPTIIFDTCAQFGRLKSVKINEATT